MELIDWLYLAIILRTIIRLTLWYLKKNDKKNKSFKN